VRKKENDRESRRKRNRMLGREGERKSHVMCVCMFAMVLKNRSTCGMVCVCECVREGERKNESETERKKERERKREGEKKGKRLVGRRKRGFCVCVFVCVCAFVYCRW